MSTNPPSEVTLLLRRWTAGDVVARDTVVPLLYDRLRQLARQRRRDRPGDPSLNTTGLVHEAYIRLVNAPHVDLPDRGHFLALASSIMRNLLLDHARARAAAKRGGGREPLPLMEDLYVSEVEADRIEELDEALRRLERLNPRQSQLLEQRYFGGLSLEETAAAAGVSLATVKRELRAARAWLAVDLGGDVLR